MPLMGIMGGGFYYHNMSLGIIQNSQRPEKNTRDILIGYILVFATYTSIGIMGVYGFLGINFSESNPSVNMIEQNCFNMFPADDKWATAVRFCIVCQILCVTTLLFGLMRQQILLLYGGIRGYSEQIQLTLP